MLEKHAKSLLNTIKDMGLDNYCQKCDIEDVDEDTDFLLEYLRHSAAVGKIKSFYAKFVKNLTSFFFLNTFGK